MNHSDLGRFFANTAGLPRSTTLTRETGLRTLLLHLNEGEEIPEHRTPGAITVHCLKGAAVFSSGGESVGLLPGLLVSLPPSAPHRVAARQETLLLVTMREPVGDEHV